MHSQEREARIGDRVNQSFDEIMLRRDKFVIFSAKWHDSEAKIGVRHFGNDIAVESGAIDHESSVHGPGSRLQHDPIWIADNRLNAVTGKHFPAALSNEFSVLGRNNLKVGDTSRWYVNATYSRRIRLNFSNLVAIQLAQSCDPICLSPAQKFLEPWNFAFFGCDNDFAADIVGMPCWLQN